jgi:hypothetical protein
MLKILEKKCLTVHMNDGKLILIDHNYVYLFFKGEREHFIKIPHKDIKKNYNSILFLQNDKKGFKIIQSTIKLFKELSND